MFASWPLFAVFGSAIVYTVGALCAKRSLASGATVWQVNFAANMAMSLLYLPFWLGADLSKLWTDGYRPVLTAAAFFTGQLFTFAALRKGDVSVATPLLGAKVIFVAFITSLLFGGVGRVEMVAGRRDLHLRDFPGHRLPTENGSMEPAFPDHGGLFVDRGGGLCPDR